MSKDATGTQSAKRALTLLKAFADDPSGLRVSALSKQTGMGQSTVSRLLGTLESSGYVRRDTQSGVYYLDLNVISLAGAALNQSSVYRETRQIAQELACDLGLGVNLAERRGASIFYLLHFEGRLAPRSFTMMGRTNPLHATGLGKCLISELPDTEVEGLIPDLPSFTSRTITKHKALREELYGIRRLGYAKELEELALGRACVATPIRDRTGGVVAALSISGSLSAIDLETREAELANIVIEAADQVSVGLGYVAALRIGTRQ